MDHNSIVQETLDLFCSSSEQTYKEFLGSFTCLSNGDTGNCGLKSISDRPLKVAPVREKDEAKQTVPEAGTSQGHAALPADQDEMVLATGITIGGFQDGLISLAERVKLDNFLNSQDFGYGEEGHLKMETAQGTLPGEAQDALPAYLPSFHQTQLECSAGKKQQEPASSAFTVDTEEVFPFCIDENFDYDRVVLSHKYPPSAQDCRQQPETNM
ncbi:intraflagellar transport-associated protein [Amia ocellicauda]|uniref:intraflagellar transport-associated protein n=1 Tax=Amia ocellicauda TaxID=2972642 RepID=UPI0034638803